MNMMWGEVLKEETNEVNIFLKAKYPSSFTVTEEGISTDQHGVGETLFTTLSNTNEEEHHSYNVAFFTWVGEKFDQQTDDHVRNRNRNGADFGEYYSPAFAKLLTSGLGPRAYCDPQGCFTAFQYWQHVRELPPDYSKRRVEEEISEAMNVDWKGK
jgi:hypothetical protein